MTRTWEALIPNKPILYSITDNSARLYPAGYSLLQLPRELRAVALGGTISFDLRSAQLATVARSWNLPKLTGMLAAGEKIWKQMLTALHLPKAAKPALKTAIYSFVFGMPQSGVASELTIELIADGLSADRAAVAADAFFRLPAVAEILEGQKRRIAAAVRDGCLTTVLGEVLLLPQTGTKKEGGTLLRARWRRSSKPSSNA